MKVMVIMCILGTVVSGIAVDSQASKSGVQVGWILETVNNINVK